MRSCLAADSVAFVADPKRLIHMGYESTCGHIRSTILCRHINHPTGRPAPAAFAEGQKKNGHV